jgi:hypothetical protein
MPDVTIRVRDNGPFLVEGPFKLVDATGGEFSLDSTKPAIALCRCGHSAKAGCYNASSGRENSPR